MTVLGLRRSLGQLGSLGRLSPTPPGKGVRETIVVNGITYRLLYSRTTGQYLTSRTTGEPLYGRVA